MVKQIIKEAMEKNPIGLKEAVQAELAERLQLALEAKKKSYMEDDHYDDDEEDLEESEQLNEELLTTLATVYLVGKFLPAASAAVLLAVGGGAYALLKAIEGGEKLKRAIDDAKRKADSNKVRAARERLEKANEVSKDPKKGGMLRRLADKALSVIKRKAKKSDVTEDLIYESFEDAMYMMSEELGYLEESKMDDKDVLSAAKALAKNGKDAKTRSFGQGLVDYHKENGSFTPAQVGGLQNIMKNASFQLAKED